MLRKTCLLLLVIVLIPCFSYGQSSTNSSDSNSAKAYYNRGVTWADKGDYDRAISDYNKAIELNPNYTKAYNNRGVTWSKKGDYDRSISDCSKAIELNPNCTDAYNNRAVSYYFKGEYDRAWDDVGKVQSLGHQVHPGFLEALRKASGRLR
jgi:tetratricopeptide (TPR) repeat protein